MLFVILLSVWLLVGLITVWCCYHGLLKQYWDFDKRNNGSGIREFCGLIPVGIVFGPITVILCIDAKYKFTWYFTTKGRKK